MPVTNIAQGGNKVIALLGVKEMQKRIDTIVGAFVKDEAGDVVGGIAHDLGSDVRAAARGVNLPRRAQQDIFVYTRQPGGFGKQQSVTALVGVRKKGRNADAKGYVTWYPSRQTGSFDKKNRSRRRGARLVIPGFRNDSGALQKIGENRATMWEFGTTKMAPRPWFRPTITSARSGVFSKLAAGYRKILERHSA